MSGGSGAGAGVGGGVGSGNGGVSGLGMAGASAPVVPVQNGALYRFSFDGIVFEVDPRVGARIVTFSLDGKNILTGPSANPDNFGSTYWPSPQSVWNWPPPAEIDKLAYAAHIEGNTLVLDGMVNTALQLSVTKRFRVDHAHGQMVLEFVLNNTGNAAATWAAWAISRVAPGGLTFLGLGAGGSIANNGSTPATFAIQNGVAWYDDAAVPGNTSTKNFFDGQGWLAHVIPADRLLFVQSFPDVAIGAAAEAEIEIYVDGARKYVELEAQGTKTSIAAGGTMSWTERWSLTKLDASVSLSVGSQSLLDATMAVVGKF